MSENMQDILDQTIQCRQILIVDEHGTPRIHFLGSDKGGSICFVDQAGEARVNLFLNEERDVFSFATFDHDGKVTAEVHIETRTGAIRAKTKLDSESN